MSSVFKKKHKKIPPAFLQEGILAPRVPYLNDIAAQSVAFCLILIFGEDTRPNALNRFLLYYMVDVFKRKNTQYFLFKNAFLESYTDVIW